MVASRDGDKRRCFGDHGPVARVGENAEDGSVSLTLIQGSPGGWGNARSLASVELEGGPLAYRTELIDVSVTPGAQLWLAAEDARGTAGAPAEPPVVVWGEPALSGRKEELNLLDLDLDTGAADASAQALCVTRHRAPSTRVVLLGGRPIDNALITHVSSAIGWRVPEGYTRLVVECGFDGSALPSDPNVRVRCVVFIFGETPSGDAR